MSQELKQKDEKDLGLSEQPEKSSLMHNENKSLDVLKLLLRLRYLWIRKLNLKKNLNVPYQRKALPLGGLMEQTSLKDRYRVMNYFPIMELPWLNTGSLTHGIK